MDISSNKPARLHIRRCGHCNEREISGKGISAHSCKKQCHKGKIDNMQQNS